MEKKETDREKGRRIDREQEDENRESKGTQSLLKLLKSACECDLEKKCIGEIESGEKKRGKERER